MAVRKPLALRTGTMLKSLKQVLTLALPLALTGSALVIETSAQHRGRPSKVRAPQSLSLPRLRNRKPRNILFILTDDQRYDAIGFLRPQSFLETPNLDALARGGVYLPNAFVTTALCSPSRASILTGMYAHRHRVVDNDSPLPANLVYFPQYLQRAGYETAFIGKWHMGGHIDHPQPGFNHWFSFKGQGSYLPVKDGFNVNGKPVPQTRYITDELTDYALRWLNERKGNNPFMLYLSHKAVHAEFIPAERHRGRYQNKEFIPPKTMNPAHVEGAPMWVQNQRNSWHGVEFPYHSNLDVGEYYKRYAETMLAVDESLGRIVDLLKAKGWFDSTLIVFMGDNGFSFGEHGLIDKRTAYEESMRVPMVVQCPELFRGGNVVSQVVANIDIAPTMLEAAGLKPPDYMDGRSFISLAEGKPITWRDFLLYEYYWESPFPQTPTMFALRGDQYKYIHYYGLWDSNELYDIKADPLESRNLITSPKHQKVVTQLRTKLFEILTRTNGMYIPLYLPSPGQQNLRREDGSKPAQFPPHLINKPK